MEKNKPAVSKRGEPIDVISGPSEIRILEGRLGGGHGTWQFQLDQWGETHSPGSSLGCENDFLTRAIERQLMYLFCARNLSMWNFP